VLFRSNSDFTPYKLIYYLALAIEEIMLVMYSKAYGLYTKKEQL